MRAPRIHCILLELHTCLRQPEIKGGRAHGITNIPKRVSPGAQHNNGRLPAIAARPYATARPGPALGNRLSAWAATIGWCVGTSAVGRRSPSSRSRSTAGRCGWGPSLLWLGLSFVLPPWPGVITLRVLLSSAVAVMGADDKKQNKKWGDRAAPSHGRSNLA